jgi:peptide/nickel transport system substrate-binding protein
MKPTIIKTYRLSAIFSAVVLIGVSLLTACGNQSANVHSVRHGGSVTIVPSPSGQHNCPFNPFIELNDDCFGTNGLIFEPLIFTNRINGQTTPWLAEKYTWSADAKTLTLNLRQNVKWTDGQPFTSADVAYTFNTLKQFPKLDTSGIWKQLQTINTPDKNTVIMAFSAPALSMLWFIGTQTFIVPQHTWKDISDPEKAKLSKPVGTGPFILDINRPDLYTLKRNPSYWQAGKPYIDEVRFPAYDPNTGTSVLLAQGSVDWAGVYTASIQQSYTSLDPAHNHYWFVPSSLVVLSLNQLRKPFQAVAVRQAISLAIDRDTIAKQAESDYTPAAPPSGIVLPGFQSYLDPNYAGLAYHQDIQQAKTLLASAGYTPGSDDVMANAAGDRLSFTLNVVDGWTDWVKTTELISSQLSAINIDVHIQKLTFSNYYAQQQLGKFDMSISWSSSGPTPFYQFNDMLNSKQTAPDGEEATSNWIRWNDSKTDSLLQNYLEATNTDQQRTAIMGLEQIMVEQLPTLPLFYSLTWNEYSTARFVGWPDANNPYAAGAPYSYPDIEVILLNIHQP